MKKKLFAFALCVIMAVTMAVPAFAAESETGIVNIPIGSSIQPRTDVGSQYFQLSGTSLYLNINNSAHPGSAQANDVVIIWTDTAYSDKLWTVTYGSYGGYYFRTQLNLDLAMNINHAQNKCTLYSPLNNTTSGKSDSDVYMNGNRIQLSQWPYQLTNTVPQSGYTCYWTASGSDYITHK
ncbi:hypothetical protein DXA32_14740 [Subdoligranulum sp. OF01-18]|uniref:hypothetical protein n=1 Tax=Ruthenibacterium lactatiformans TaxID=1550024 RepID=UPI0006D761BF|nr:hypothetical protein [Ruthenibacterium lactatiformans]RJW80592.1 hypothetical protein DXA32_14740 [Subdoligranulum sp. OF01-18]